MNPDSQTENHLPTPPPAPARSGPEVAGWDPLEQAFIANPDAVHARAHREAPVFYYAQQNMWVVTRYEDVRSVVTDWQTFSSRAFRMVPPPDDLADRIPKNLSEPAFVNIDPPTHTVDRRNANTAFTRSRVAEMEPMVEEIANDLIDAFVADGTCDLMQQYCYPLSLRVIVRMLGLSENDMASYRQWTEDFFALMSPGPADDLDTGSDRPMDAAEIHARYERLAEGYAYYKAFVAERTAHPRDDLTSALIAARDEDGSPALSVDSIICHMIELTAAGNDTTANLIANAVMFLNDNPGQREALMRDRSLLANTVEEALRRRPTSPHMYRITTRDVMLGDVAIPARSLVCVSFGASSNDDATFPDPYRFDIQRENADHHLAFGHGRHKCLGAPLARLEARVGLGALLDRLPDLRVPEQTLRYVPMVTLQTLIELNVRWSAAAEAVSG